MYKGFKNVKIKSFFDHEEYGINTGGSTYITCTYAKDKVEKFINLPNINVLDIKFTQNGIYVIYRKEPING